MCSTTRRWLPGLVGFLAATSSGTLLAAEDSTARQTGLAAIDWAIIVAYGCGTIALGWYYSRKQSTTQEYFIGNGQMNPILIGVSLFATLLSTISYLSMPGEAFGKGPAGVLSTLAFPFVFLFVGYVLLPVYMQQRVTSAYELLEKQLGLSVRLLGAGMFLTLRLIWMALLTYLTAKAMTVMLGVGDEWIPAVALITGTVSVVYTSLGGLRAVVITDLLQTILLYGGALVVIGGVSWNLGGFGWFPTEWHDNWDTQPFFSVDPQVRITVVGSFVSVLLWQVSTLGGDQTSVQRFMSTSDVKAARRALAIQLAVAFVVAITLAVVGFALLGYFEAHPDQIPQGVDLKKNADIIFPRFVAYHLPPGVSGFVVAAMFAAAMSSIDSGVNSITAVVMSDLLDRFGIRPKTERQHVLLARSLALGIGLTIVLCSSMMQHVPGNITAVTNKTANLLATPIFCLFVFAIFVPFASPIGVWIGAACGVVTAVVVAFSGPLVTFLDLSCGIPCTTFGVELVTSTDSLTGELVIAAPDPISFQWIAPLAIGANLLTGCVVSYLFPRR